MQATSSVIKTMPGSVMLRAVSHSLGHNAEDSLTDNEGLNFKPEKRSSMSHR